MKSYHFDCGNSYKGPVGFCARVRADSKKEATRILNEFLLEALGGQKEVLSDSGPIEFIEVYFGLVKKSHIDDFHDIKESK